MAGSHGGLTRGGFVGCRIDARVDLAREERRRADTQALSLFRICDFI